MTERPGLPNETAAILAVAAAKASSIPADPAPAAGGLPKQIVVDARGFYWRDYGDHYSMCPVSDDNEPVEVVATYLPLPLRALEALFDHPDARDHAEVLPNGAGHQWRCIPIAEAIETAAPMTASGSRIAEITERHRRDIDGAGTPICAWCDVTWPCDASILAAMLTPERLAAALQLELNRAHRAGDYDELAAALLAILAALEAHDAEVGA